MKTFVLILCAATLFITFSDALFKKIGLAVLRERDSTEHRTGECKYSSTLLS